MTYPSSNILCGNGIDSVIKEDDNLHEFDVKIALKARTPSKQGQKPIGAVEGQVQETPKS